MNIVSKIKKHLPSGWEVGVQKSTNTTSYLYVINHNVIPKMIQSGWKISNTEIDDYYKNIVKYMTSQKVKI